MIVETPTQPLLVHSIVSIYRDVLSSICIPFSLGTPDPSVAAASNVVPLIVKTLTGSFDLTVVTALPKLLKNMV